MFRAFRGKTAALLLSLSLAGFSVPLVLAQHQHHDMGKPEAETIGTVHGAKTEATGQPPSSVGQWTAAPINIGVVGIHSALLNNGLVLLYYYPSTVGGNSPAVLFNPANNAVTSVTIPDPYDFFCSGINVMPDGRVLVTGGLNGIPPAGDYGIPQAEIFNPSTSSWTPAANMNFGRWYPTNIELPNGTTLTLSGENAAGTAVVAPLEEYNETTNTWTVLKTTANLPPGVETYPRVYVTTDGNVLMAGQLAPTRKFSVGTNTWSTIATMEYGNRIYGGAVLLPGMEQILVAGGHASTTGPATNTAEILDLTQPSPAWTYTAHPMNFPRYNANFVLLPDGNVVAIGGNQSKKYGDPVEAAELYVPSNQTWTTMASQIARRGYHSTALLLPDGRVLSAGSDDIAKPDYSQTVEIYKPPYLFKGARPKILTSPATIHYNTNFTLTSNEAATITSVALLRPGAVTHAQNYDQRMIPLTFTVSGTTITATAPASANYAPPGYYMVVIVNSAGVPSVMPFLSVGP